MIVIRASKTPLPGAIETEEIVEDLFGKGPRALVARMMLVAPMSRERTNEIRKTLRAKFPYDFEVRRMSSLDQMINEVKATLDDYQEAGGVNPKTNT